LRTRKAKAWDSFTPQEWEQIREGGRLSLSVPEIRARAMSEFARTINVMAEVLARRTGRPPDDLRVRVLAGAVIGVMMAIFLPGGPGGPGAGAEDESGSIISLGPDSVARIDEALALLECGFPL
jgi:hypothetical protein